LHVLDDLLEEAPPVDKCMVTVSCCLLVQLLCQEIRRTKYNLYCFTCILFSMPLSWGVPWFHYLQVYRILLFMGHLLHWDCCFFWEKVTDLPHNYFGSDLARQTSFPLVLEGSPAFGGLLGSGFSDLFWPVEVASEMYGLCLLARAFWACREAVRCNARVAFDCLCLIT
jgi:hypothetical protein